MTLVRMPGASYNLAGSDELAAVRGEIMSRFDAMVRDEYRGLKYMQFPEQIVTATANGVLAIWSPTVQSGPEQGYLWRVDRLTVASSGADNSTPITPGPQVSFYLSSDGTPNPRNLVDATQAVGQAFFPRRLFLQPGQQLLAIVGQATSGNSYILNGGLFSVPAEMQGKVA